MKLDPRSVLVPLVAVAVIVLTLQMTLGALKASGTWQRPPAVRRTPVQDPYTRLDALLAAKARNVPPEGVHNPFAYGAARAGIAPNPLPKPVKHTPAPPPPPPVPILTSIVWAAVPTATVRYDGKEYSLTENSVFANFRVRSITRTGVTLDRNGESVVLTFRSKGDKP